MVVQNRFTLPSRNSLIVRARSGSFQASRTCDLPHGWRDYSLTDSPKFAGHDYPSGREKSCVSKVSDQMALNKHVGGPKASLETFVKMRSERDAQLGAPKLLHPSLQVNLRGGRMPRADPDGQVRLKIPLAGDLPM